jgi:hypothetical protein
MKQHVATTISSLTWEQINKRKMGALKIAKDLNTLVIQSYDTIASWAK